MEEDISVEIPRLNTWRIVLINLQKQKKMKNTSVQISSPLKIFENNDKNKQKDLLDYH